MSTSKCFGNFTGVKKEVLMNERKHIQVSIKEGCTISETTFMGETFEQTVYGYLSAKLLIQPNKSVGRKTSFINFLIPVKDNIFLLGGVPDLEDLSKRLEDERQKSNTAIDCPWKRVTFFIKDLIDDLISETASKCAVFIDTNTSFSIFTEMGISAAKRLIVPFTADNFSLSATVTMLNYVYGYLFDSYPQLKILKRSHYVRLARENSIRPPHLHLLVFNRVTIYAESPVSAFTAVRSKLETIVNDFYKFYENNFDTLKKCPEFDDIRDKYIIDVHDFCSLGVLSLHCGCPLSHLQPGTYKVFDKNILIEKDDQRLKNYNIDISKIVDSFTRDQKK